MLRSEGYGQDVDWWCLGILLYEFVVLLMLCYVCGAFYVMLCSNVMSVGIIYYIILYYIVSLYYNNGPAVPGHPALRVCGADGGGGCVALRCLGSDPAPRLLMKI